MAKTQNKHIIFIPNHIGLDYEAMDLQQQICLSTNFTGIGRREAPGLHHSRSLMKIYTSHLQKICQLILGYVPLSAIRQMFILALSSWVIKFPRNQLHLEVVKCKKSVLQAYTGMPSLPPFVPFKSLVMTLC